MENWREHATVAAGTFKRCDTKTIDRALLTLADEVLLNTPRIVEANRNDLEQMNPGNPLYDRLLLSPERLADIAGDIRNVAALPSPLGRILMENERPNGMKITKTSVPFGVVGIVYEARPNVSFDVFSLCFKSGNVAVLKGGSDAQETNHAIVTLIRSVLKRFGLNEDIVILLDAGRESTSELLKAVGTVDLIIPRGGRGLIDYVRANSRVPVIETGAGVCHTFFDLSGNLTTGENIVLNAKTRRVSVCNALDCLLIHEKRLPDLPALCEKLAKKNVVIYADTKAYAFLIGKYPENLLLKASADKYGIEFLDYKMSIKTVADIHEAVSHIAQYGSKHSECIVSEDDENIDCFIDTVDAACVYSNVSTAFTDGAQFGLGAEIGISTQKLHARGPMALEELCTYKWIVKGNGQIRN
jgi:glutamate-5-semialdehyde dehydrogenase